MSTIQSSANTGLTLQDFQQAGQKQADVYLDGERLVTLGAGQTPEGRQAAWVAPTGDASSSLADTLKNTVGHGLGSAIAHELGLSPAPGKPLSARTIERAISMAQEGQRALEGVDFLTQLQLSAQNHSADFTRICQSAGIDAQQINTATRKNIDAMLAERFHQAAQAGQSPVSHQQAESWLTEIVKLQVSDGHPAR